MNSSLETVGVIDVGSNSIKLLIAGRGETSPVKNIEYIVEETRIGEGMTSDPPVIHPAAIQAGAEAIQRLAAKAERCDALCIVATSAVREASNKQDFVNAVEQACGRELRILSGDEEANLIGEGMQCDPALTELDTYTLLDLGGGSLECIHFVGHRMQEAISLPLGSVRLASLIVANRHQPLSPKDQAGIEKHVLGIWQRSPFAQGSSPSSQAVLTGGAANIISEHLDPSSCQQGWSIEEFAKLGTQICRADYETRKRVFAIPESRADIFPTAMTTLQTTLEYLGCNRLYFSKYNLRYGLARILLSHGKL